MPAQPPPQRHDLLYGFYGTWPGQLAATCPTRQTCAVNTIWASMWSGEDAQIADLQEAKARGIANAVLDVQPLLFDAHYNYIGVAALAAYKARLDALGNTIPTIVALYPIDEPDVHKVSDALMLKAEGDLRAKWPEPTKIAVIYGDHAAPGISGADWVGTDNYGQGAAVLENLPHISAAQSYILIPGGSPPGSAPCDAACLSTFLAFANAHPEVSMIAPFTWGSYTFQGHTYAGIGTNGMAPAYLAVGRQIVGP